MTVPVKKMGFTIAWVQNLFQNALKDPEVLGLPQEELILDDVSTTFDNNNLSISLRFKSNDEEGNIESEQGEIHICLSFYQDEFKKVSAEISCP